MNMAGLGGWRGLSRALKCFGVRGFLRRVRQDHKVARCMAHNLARARKSESIRARIWYPGGYPGIPEDTRIREPTKYPSLMYEFGLRGALFDTQAQSTKCVPAL